MLATNLAIERVLAGVLHTAEDQVQVYLSEISRQRANVEECARIYDAERETLGQYGDD